MKRIFLLSLLAIQFSFGQSLDLKEKLNLFPSTDLLFDKGSAGAKVIKKKKSSKSSKWKGKSSSKSSNFGRNDRMVRLNIGVGPTWNFFSGKFGEFNTQYGLALDLYLVYPPTVLDEKRKNMDSRFRKFLYNPGEEMVTKPFFLALLPTHLMISPEFEDNAVYGVTVSPVGAFFSASPIREATFKFGVEAPTVSVFQIYGRDILDEELFIGVGASLKADFLMRFSERMLVSIGWTSALYLQGEDTRLEFVDGTSEKIWHIGTSEIQWHYRFGIMKE